MTGKKNRWEQAGWRPTVEECIQGWFRALGAGGPVIGVRPKGLESPGSSGSEGPRPKDLYCGKIISRAIRLAAERKKEPLLMEAILNHYAVHGRATGFRLYNLVATEKGALTGFFVDAADKSGQWLHLMVKTMRRDYCELIQLAIDNTDAFVEAVAAEEASHPVPAGRAA